MKKTAALLPIIAAFFLAACNPMYAEVKDRGHKNFNETDAMILAQKMGTGWNLGNTLDAYGTRNINSETSWGMPQTTKEMIHAIAESGFKTIRIPVSWSNHIIDSNYTIDTAWMNRVKQIVDWAIEEDMYVILNTHHDNYRDGKTVSHCGGYYPNQLNWNESLLFTRNVWRQISTAFNNGYDEHLIFEIYNEPRLIGDSHEWNFESNCTTCKNAADTLAKLTQQALNTIRESGGNNQKRFVMITGLAASPNSYLNNPNFTLPSDYTDRKIKNQRLMISVHMYTPYEFAMQSPGDITFEAKHKSTLDWFFDQLNQKFVQNGIPVIIGEYGATNKNNLQDRVDWFTYFITQSHKYNMVACLWDNNEYFTTGDFNEKFGFFNRSQLTWYFPEITTAIITAANSNQ